MTDLYAQTSGNWDTAATWATVITGNEPTAPVSGTALSTTFVAASSTVTPGAITIRGVRLKLAAISGAPGAVTITVALNTGGGTTTVVGTTVTRPVSDLPTCTAVAATGDEGGYMAFVFDSPVTLLAATAYSLTAQVSGAGPTVNLYATATTNWVYALIQNGTTNTPGAADTVFIGGEWSNANAAGTVTPRSVTMNHTSTTAILTSSGSAGAVNISQGGTLAYGTAAGAAYYLRLGTGTAQANLTVYSGGTCTQGTLGTPIPSTSSAVLEYTITAGQADNLSGTYVKNGGTRTTYGVAVTALQTTLTADAHAGDTSITVASTAGWVAGGVVGIAGTIRTATPLTQCEKATITSVTDATHAVVSALTVANTAGINHGGGATTILGTNGTTITAEVVYLSFNVAVRSTQTTLASTGTALEDYKPGSLVSLVNTEFSFCDALIETSTGSFTMTGCSVHDCRTGGLYIQSVSGSTITIAQVNLYNCNTSNALSAVTTNATTGVIVLDRVWVIGCTGIGINAADLGSTYTNCVTADTTGAGFVLGESNALIGLITGLTTHSNAGTGVQASTTGYFGTIGSPAGPIKVWRNNGNGLSLSFSFESLTLDSWVLFGNSSQNINITQGWNLLEVRNCFLTSESQFSTLTANFQPTGLNNAGNVYVLNCTFSAGVPSGIDITPPSGMGKLVMWGGSLGAATPIGPAASIGGTVYLHNVNVGGIQHCYRSYFFAGTIFNSVAELHGTNPGPAWRMVPNANATTARPLRFPGPQKFDTFGIPIPAGLTSKVDVVVWVKITAYVGTDPVALHVLGGIVAGAGPAGPDAASASADTSNLSSWQQLKATLVGGFLPTEAGMLEATVSCTGSGTIVYVSDSPPAGS